jgi:Fe-S-cluster containining protein
VESDNIQTRIEAINDALEPVWNNIQSGLEKVRVSKEPTGRRYIQLLDITKKVMDNIDPHTPCAQQCSYCCYMAVSISEHEAKLISEYTGIPFVPQPYFKTADEIHSTMERWRRTYTEVPCTFLKQGKCSIYAVRPHACRLHHTIADDNACCNLANHRSTPAVTLNHLHKAFIGLFYKWPVGEIREFFPKST